MASLTRALGRAAAILAAVAMLAQACAESDTSGSGTTSGSGGMGPIGIGGSSSSTGGEEQCAETTASAEEGVLPADIIVAVDTSGSMDDEAVWTQNNMQPMVDTIVASMVDVHLVMIADPNDICVPASLGSGNCPADENLPAYRHIADGVSSTNAFEKILNTYDQWKDSLRPNATKTVVVVSDDNSDMSANDFKNALIAKDASFQGFKFDAIVSSSGGIDLALTCLSCQQSAIIGCGSSCDPCCASDSGLCMPLGAAEGSVYADLVTQTSGVIGDLCQQDFGPVFQDMATAIVQGAAIDCVYDIPEPGEGEMIDYGKVNVDYYATPNGPAQPILHVPVGGVCGPEGGWYYDDPINPTQIVLCEATCSAVQDNLEGEIVVKFGCTTKIIVPK